MSLTSCAVGEFCVDFPIALHSLNINTLDFGAGAHLKRPSKVISLAMLFSIIPCTAQRREGVLGLPSAPVPWGLLLTMGETSRVAERCWFCWTINTFLRVSVHSGMFSSPSHDSRNISLLVSSHHNFSH